MATSIRLSPETERRLDYIASKTRRTKAFYIREMIERSIDDVGGLLPGRRSLGNAFATAKKRSSLKMK